MLFEIARFFISISVLIVLVCSLAFLEPDTITHEQPTDAVPKKEQVVEPTPAPEPKGYENYWSIPH